MPVVGAGLPSKLRSALARDRVVLPLVTDIQQSGAGIEIREVRIHPDAVI